MGTPEAFGTGIGGAGGAGGADAVGATDGGGASGGAGAAALVGAGDSGAAVPATEGAGAGAAADGAAGATAGGSAENDARGGVPCAFAVPARNTITEHDANAAQCPRAKSCAIYDRASAKRCLAVNGGIREPPPSTNVSTPRVLGRWSARGRSGASSAAHSPASLANRAVPGARPSGLPRAGAAVE